MGLTRKRPLPALFLLLAIVGGLGITDTSAALPAADCTVADPALEGPPAGLPATDVLPVRNDPDGARTLVLVVDDPVFGGDTYNYTDVATAPGGDASIGVYSHRWPTARRLVAYGATVRAQGTRYRVPLFIVENGASEDIPTALLVAAMNEAIPLLNNSTPFIVNTAVPSSPVVALGGLTVAVAPVLVGALVPVVGPLVAGTLSPVTTPTGLALAGGSNMWSNSYPTFSGYATIAPLYVWTAYRNAGPDQAWAGTVMMHNGTFTNAGATREGCRRTRIGIATRTGAGTTYGGGVYVLDHVVGMNSAGDTFEATETITAGVSVMGSDVPVTSVHQTETKRGTSPFSEGTAFYPSYQRDEITLNARVADTFVPLIGTRAEAAFAAPPQAENRLFSVGVYDPLGAYHPVVGGRTHFEQTPGDVWALLWALSGGPGAAVGDWEADLGTFDPAGAFVPLFGVTYDDAIHDVPTTLYRYQMMITAGPWVAGTYHPILGVTYDGETPLAFWALANAGGNYGAMGRWLVSAGTFSPLGPYVPLAGASYQPGSNPPYQVVEEYRIGAFTASYPDFVPIAEARWSGSVTSGAWAIAFALSQGSQTTDSRLDIGPVVAGSFMPVAGIHARPGRPQHYDIGPWVLGGFVPLLTACFSPPSVTPGSGVPTIGNGYVGVAVNGTSVAWVGRTNGSPSAGALSDCPA